MTTEEVLQQCTIEGTTIKLPAVQLDRKSYQDVSKKLELIGGKWKGNKVMGFVFNEDPTELLAQIASGEKRNIKKEFQFFGTPDSLADKLVDYASISSHHSILEPSAGQGALVNAIHRIDPKIVVDCYELMPLNQTFLRKLPNVRVLGEDYIAADTQRYDRIIANPPFSKNQDIDHIYKMANRSLKIGGKLVTIASKHWQLSNNKKEADFRNWLTEINAEVYNIQAGEFKESGTSIATCVIIIQL
ncbi:hypothetical protein A0256_23205 [Mucilaginibacter sp. PAMC 26640]|nr:hypothetical protein A0256_23205 [Mucilaginibacter sp. PAMC 26640]